MVVAGPVAQALYGFALYLIATQLLRNSPVLNTVLILVAATQWTSVLFSVVPMRAGRSRNDGSILQSVLTSGPSTASLMRVVRWNDYLLSGETPGSWPADIVEAQEAALTPGASVRPIDIELAILAGYHLYLYYADRHDWAEANHVLTRAVELPRLQGLSKATGPFDLIDVLSAIHLSLRGQNALAARAALARIGPRSSIRRNSLAVGAQASVDLVEKNLNSAILLATKAIRELERADSTTGANRLQASWWEEVISTAKRSLPAMRPGPIPTSRTATPVPQLRIGAIDSERVGGPFSWDPGVASDVRTAWILRRPITDYDLRG
jgi:hypothetical protein